MKRDCIIMMLSGWLAVACQAEDVVVNSNKEVSLDLSVHTTEMQQADPTTRSDKDPSEKVISNVYVVQFNGTASATAKVVKSGVAIYNRTANTLKFDFVAVNATCRIYVVANFNPVASNDALLSAFEKWMTVYAASPSIDPLVGIPMCGYVDFNPVTQQTMPKVTLTATVAKLVVKYTVDPAALPFFKPGTTVNSLSIAMKNVINGTTYGTPISYTAAWRPTNVAYSTKAVGGTGNIYYTYYVPENIAGNSSVYISHWSKRSLANAPANALYFEITGRNAANNGTCTIVSFMGASTEPNAFNVKRNWVYQQTMVIRNVDGNDGRITVKFD